MPSNRVLEACKAVNSIVPFTLEDQSSLLGVIEDYFTSSDPGEADSSDSETDEDESIGKF